MFAAYGLICYAAYFDALDQQLPEVKRLLGMTAADRFALSTAAAERLQKQADLRSEPDAAERLRSCGVRLPLPHPPLRANMDETDLLVVITEQGENRNPCEEQRNIFGFSCFSPGFARLCAT